MALEADILSLEKKFWDAMKTKDAEAASAMMGDACVVAGAQGVASIDKATFARMTAEGKWTLQEYELRDVTVVSPAPDVAVIGYRVSERIIVDGRPMTLEAADTSVWCRRDGTWLCFLHTESVLGDPFGGKA
jgi:ketosteroid isomerase-like protein